MSRINAIATVTVLREDRTGITEASADPVRDLDDIYDAIERAVNKLDGGLPVAAHIAVDLTFGPTQIG